MVLPVSDIIYNYTIIATTYAANASINMVLLIIYEGVTKLIKYCTILAMYADYDDAMQFTIVLSIPQQTT